MRKNNANPFHSYFEMDLHCFLKKQRKSVAFFEKYACLSKRMWN